MTASTASAFQSPESELRRGLKERRPPHSELGCGLDPLIAGYFSTAPFDLSLTGHPAECADRRAAALSLLRELLILPGALEAPSDPIRCGRSVFSDHIVEKVEFTASPPLRVRAHVVMPRRGSRPYPAVVALHSMGSYRLFGKEKLLAFEGEPASLTQYRERCYSGRSLQVDLARRGYLSIAIDAFNFGHRTMQGQSDPEGFQGMRMRLTPEEAQHFSFQIGHRDDALAQRALGVVGTSLAALVATDDLRTVRYLLTRDDVDPARIGCAGLSFGSFRANYLSALEPLIRAAVSVCWISTLRGIVGYNIPGAIGFFAVPPLLYRRMDMTDIVALSAPKPFLAISAWQDVLMQPFGVAEAHLALRKVWARQQKAEALGSLVYDCGHEFNDRMQQAAWAFLDNHLA